LAYLHRGTWNPRSCSLVLHECMEYSDGLEDELEVVPNMGDD
jgi:hypothetical protein